MIIEKVTHERVSYFNCPLSRLGSTRWRENGAESWGPIVYPLSREKHNIHRKKKSDGFVPFSSHQDSNGDSMR